MTTYTLLDRPNPNGPHFYPTRRQKCLAVVVHITAGLEDLDGVDDHSAENTAAYASNTDRAVSWHSGSDTDSWVDLLPAYYTAWHVLNYNSCTYGHELSKTHTDWSVMPGFWVAATLTRAAPGLAAVAAAYGIPLRKATRAELDREIAKGSAGQPVGFISHAELQPEDRTDPGMVRGRDTFPWDVLFALMAGSSGPKPERNLTNVEDLMAVIVTRSATPQRPLGWAALIDRRTGASVWDEDPAGLRKECDAKGVFVRDCSAAQAAYWLETFASAESKAQIDIVGDGVGEV